MTFNHWFRQALLELPEEEAQSEFYLKTTYTFPPVSVSLHFLDGLGSVISNR